MALLIFKKKKEKKKKNLQETGGCHQCVVRVRERIAPNAGSARTLQGKKKKHHTQSITQCSRAVNVRRADNGQ
jgi:hypothetical protein